MSRQLWLGALLMSCAFTAHAIDMTPEERLQAIRAALVEAAMKSSTRVSATSWVDAQGSMHELNRFSSEVKLREIQVQGFKRDQNSELQADFLAKTDPVNSESCSAPEAKRAIKQVMTLNLIEPKNSPPNKRYITQQVGRLFKSDLSDQAGSSQHWYVVPEGPSTDAYNRLSYGHGEEGIGWHMQISVTSLNNEDQRDLSSFMIEVQVSNREQQRAWLTLQDTVTGQARGLPDVFVEKVSKVLGYGYGPATEKPKIDVQLRSSVEQLAKKMAVMVDDSLACHPQVFKLNKVSGGFATLNVGSKAGLRVGDKLMVVNDRFLPEHLLETDALNFSVLAEVYSVSNYQAEIKQVAGKNVKIQNDWVVWPYIY